MHWLPTNVGYIEFDVILLGTTANHVLRQPVTTTWLKVLAVVEQSLILRASGPNLSTQLQQTLCFWTHQTLTRAGVLLTVVSATDFARLVAQRVAILLLQANASSFKLRIAAVTATSSRVRHNGAVKRCLLLSALQTHQSASQLCVQLTTTATPPTLTCRTPIYRFQRASDGTMLRWHMRKSAAPRATLETGVKIATAKRLMASKISMTISAMKCGSMKQLKKCSSSDKTTLSGSYQPFIIRYLTIYTQ